MLRDLPEDHFAFLTTAVHRIAEDGRFLAVLGGGSLIHGGFDRWSDLDLVLITDPDMGELPVDERKKLAADLGNLIACFTGEHVGEPRLLIALYGPELLHVDLKFADLSDLDRRVERPRILWAGNEGAIAQRLDRAQIAWPEREAQWFEDRFWIWLHYGAAKLHRGELFEAIGMLAFIREQVLGPMLARRTGQPQRGVRRLDDTAAGEALKDTLAGYDRQEIRRALEAATGLYLALRSDAPPANPALGMPDAIRRFLARPA